MMRRIKTAERGERCTFINLECGHARSIGGHTWPTGRPVGQPTDLVGTFYDCHDGRCGVRA